MKITAKQGMGRKPNPYLHLVKDPVNFQTFNDFEEANPPLPVYKDGKPFTEDGEFEAEVGIIYNNCIMTEWPANLTDEKLTKVFIIPSLSTEPEGEETLEYEIPDKTFSIADCKNEVRKQTIDGVLKLIETERDKWNKNGSIYIVLQSMLTKINSLTPKT